MLQNATPLRKSAPWLPNISQAHVFCTAPAMENASLQILFKCPTLAMVFGNATKPSRFAHFWQGAQSLAPATRNDIWTSKSGANMWCFVHVDFEMCFAPQRRALFPKSGPSMVCFVHFVFEMCFAPQRRALFRHRNFQMWSDTEVLYTFWFRNVLRTTAATLFRHLNFQKWSEAEVLCTFWLGNLLRATTTCNVSSLIWPGVSAPAALARPTFRPSGATNYWKNSVSRLSYLFAHLHLRSSDSLLFSLPLPCSAFHLSILSEVWLLNFLRSYA